LSFPIEGTRLYHDRFNLSANPIAGRSVADRSQEDHAIPVDKQTGHRKKIVAATVLLSAAVV
jgi:hypothetical protein